MSTQTTWGQRLKIYVEGNQTYECGISQLDSIVFVTSESVIEDEHEWVDLGLPSGTQWATCNIGATSPEKCGSYFAWGETKPKSEFTSSNYLYSQGSSSDLLKYCFNNGYNGLTDGLTELLPEDDAATMNWGNYWQMPNLAQFVELINSNYTKTAWTTMNRKEGMKITSKINGNSIFLPSTGYRRDTDIIVESAGYYWSRSLNLDESWWAYSLNAAYNNTDLGRIGTYGKQSRHDGLPIRPVRKK